MNEPLVTVILAVYNGEKYLKEAIDSILEQTYIPLEIVVIDDGSDDGTGLIAHKYYSDIRYVFQTNQGQSAAMNVGLQLAKGSYIAFLDADDLFLPDKTLLQVNYLQTTPHMDMVFGHVEQFISPELDKKTSKRWKCPPGNSPGFLAQAGLFRKNCFERIGFFDPQHRIGAFIDWYMRSQEQGLKSLLMPHLVMRRRIHGGNIGLRHADPCHEYLQIVKTALTRRQLACIHKE
jgi:glycosyltransferase involved in cell wall biosynthesis